MEEKDRLLLEQEQQLLQLTEDLEQERNMVQSTE